MSAPLFFSSLTFLYPIVLLDSQSDSDSVSVNRRTIRKYSLTRLPVSDHNYYEQTGSCNRNRNVLTKHLALFLALCFYISANISRPYQDECVLMLACEKYRHKQKVSCKHQSLSFPAVQHVSFATRCKKNLLMITSFCSSGKGNF